MCLQRVWKIIAILLWNPRWLMRILWTFFQNITHFLEILSKITKYRTCEIFFREYKIHRNCENSFENKLWNSFKHAKCIVSLNFFMKLHKLQNSCFEVPSKKAEGLWIASFKCRFSCEILSENTVRVYGDSSEKFMENGWLSKEALSDYSQLHISILSTYIGIFGTRKWLESV